MRNLTFAAGIAAGYVLGARAGQERYEQIAKSARGLADHPAVVQAQSKVKDLVGVATDAVATKVSSGIPDTERVPVDRSTRRSAGTPTPTTPGAVDDV